MIIAMQIKRTRIFYLILNKIDALLHPAHNTANSARKTIAKRTRLITIAPNHRNSFEKKKGGRYSTNQCSYPAIFSAI